MNKIFAFLLFILIEIFGFQTESEVFLEQLESYSDQPAVIEISPSPSSISSPSPILGQENIVYDVVRIVDGDTFKVDIDGTVETVRIVGINTPESVDPNKPVECFAKEASEKLKNLLSDKQVALEIDETQNNRDRYKRLLRFVKLDDEDIGLIMIREGYAQEKMYSTKPHTYRELYLDAQEDAKINKRGLWGDSICESATLLLDVTETSENNQNYSCSGPDLDCNDFTTHSEAQAFFERCNFTAEYDPMRLDSVKVGDGVACESLPL